ncbi:MAG: DUF4126 domain-containing protein [Chromatiaceae bacterium]|nr:DUF4126 domain-containing protein [Chromatiaceae bacterium]MCP5422021.1 DUF4126 domain-containing protein [Chromatiaceae bacterium]
METIDTVALMLGAAWASGINLYAAILVLGWLGGAGHVALPADLQILGEPVVMLAAGGMYAIEFFADKIPGVDTAWDALHTFIRIPAGALLAAGAAQGFDVGPAAQLAALLVGGGIASASHAVKAGSRVVINTSPEPFSNWGASLAEDAAVVGGLWASLHHPLLFLALFALFMLLLAWLLPRLWRAIRGVLGRIGRWFSGRPSAPNDIDDRDVRGGNAPRALRRPPHNATAGRDR